MYQNIRKFLDLQQHSNGRSKYPHPDTYQRLKANLALNGVSNVRPIHAAVGSHSGELSLMTGTDSNMARAHDSELIRWNRDAPGYELSRAIQVPMYSLDDVLRQHNISHVHLMKVDIEGYELECKRQGDRTWRG